MPTHNRILTVGDLEKKLKKLDKKLPIYWADHDHGEYEWNSRARLVLLMDQNGVEESVGHEFRIKGPYVLIRP